MYPASDEPLRVFQRLAAVSGDHSLLTLQLQAGVVQVPNDIPSNYHGNEPYVPQPGSRIPDMSSVMNPNWKPPQA